MIRVRHLARRFSRGDALLDVTLDVNRGESVLLRGPAGAGRTTLLRILATLVPPDGGTAEIDGYDVVKDRAAARARSILADGWLAAADGFRVREYLQFAIGCRERRTAGEIAALCGRAGLDDRARVDGLTADGRARLSLASALASPVHAVLLDEPLRHLEPAARSEFAAWVDERCKAGAAVLTACGDASDAAVPADRVVIIDQGRSVSGLRAVAGAWS